MTGVGLDDLRFETGGGTHARSRPGKLDWGAERAIQAVKEGVRLQTEFETQLFASGDPSRSHMLVREREREREKERMCVKSVLICIQTQDTFGTGHALGWIFFGD